jgi:cytochrome b pre-mRNA-processing protein 3
MILNRLFRSQELPERRLYAAIVAAARHADLYRDMGVADTVEGRFEMVVLHLFLVLNRLKDAGVDDLRQSLTDEFFNDMDGSLRELGVSDVLVGKKVRKLAESYYGRVMAYDRALADPQLLEEVVDRNIFPDGTAAGRSAALSWYVVTAVQVLATVPVDKILQSDLKFK